MVRKVWVFIWMDSMFRAGTAVSLELTLNRTLDLCHSSQGEEGFR